MFSIHSNRTVKRDFFSNLLGINQADVTVKMDGTILIKEGWIAGNYKENKPEDKTKEEFKTLIVNALQDNFLVHIYMNGYWEPMEISLTERDFEQEKIDAENKRIAEQNAKLQKETFEKEVEFYNLYYKEHANPANAEAFVTVEEFSDLNTYFLTSLPYKPVISFMSENEEILGIYRNEIVDEIGYYNVVIGINGIPTREEAIFQQDRIGMIYDETKTNRYYNPAYAFRAFNEYQVEYAYWYSTKNREGKLVSNRREFCTLYVSKKWYSEDKNTKVELNWGAWGSCNTTDSSLFVNALSAANKLQVDLQNHYDGKNE